MNTREQNEKIWKRIREKEKQTILNAQKEIEEKWTKDYTDRFVERLKKLGVEDDE